ncbi:hypothetical protein [Hymenobacter wooponensis]|uniref:Uncharacterized protein n=1 Tax=Hymenobacter wooponensis TaxID=1525360 RepID=A0A4Z0MJG9_9BACT|nr:hypothetical protein [Hymenobacter wooponensis]TGD79335.1 hypothetical protein EU557_13940 [Hymenobacter wooponensis]
MKKASLFAASLLFALSSMAQGPSAPTAKHTSKENTKEHKHEAKNQDEKVNPDNHGQEVQAFAHATPLTGADKGAAISALASNGRSSARGQRMVGSARGDRGHSGTRAADCGHQGGGHQGAVGHHTGR